MPADDDPSEPTDLSAFTDAEADGNSVGDDGAGDDDAADGDGAGGVGDDEGTANSDATGDGTASNDDGSSGLTEQLAETDANRPREETVALGVELLAHLEVEELALPEAMDRIETITTDPTVSRDILDTAETRGIIERDGATIRTRTKGVEIEFERQVVRRNGDYDCKRCGKGLSTGHFVQFETGEVGPFGSSCIKKVTGRE